MADEEFDPDDCVESAFRNPFKFIVLVFTAIQVIVVATNWWVTVPSGHVGIHTSWGKFSNQPLLPGFSVINPWWDDVIIVDTKLGEFSIESSCASSDIQQVITQVSLQYRLEDALVPKLYARIGNREHLQETILVPAVLESTKSVTANFTAEELVTKRSQVKDRVITQLMDFINSSLTQGDAIGAILIQNVNIKDFTFSSSYNEAIETKVKAEQEALQAKNDKQKQITKAEGWARQVEIQANATAFQIIENAKAQAFAIEEQAEALADSGKLLQLRMAERWDGKLPVYNFADEVPLLGHIMQNSTR